VATEPRCAASLGVSQATDGPGLKSWSPLPFGLAWTLDFDGLNLVPCRAGMGTRISFAPSTTF